MIYIKITHGWVAQHYDSETGDCVQQEFIPDAQEPVTRQDDAGQPISADQQTELENTEKECAMDMVQP
jgi:hypothetical protein